jgi:hypothetical protein
LVAKVFVERELQAVALDWIKIECALPDKPELLLIAQHCGLELDCALGKLVRLFVWYDKHLTQGDDPRVTRAMIDEVTRTRRFAESMVACGWLTDGPESSVRIEKFERHNSKSAKHRALTALRQKNFRNSRQLKTAQESPEIIHSHDDSVTKRRERKQPNPKSKSAGNEDEGNEPGVTAKAEVPALPDWLPADAWQSFVAMRVKIKKPLTDEAIRIAVQRLAKFRAAGHDIREVLENSVLGSYQGLFEPRTAGKPVQQGFEGRDYKSAETNAKDIPWLNDDGNKAA